MSSEWLKKAQRGDAQAFTSLLEAYERPVFNLCYRMLGNAQDAEDAAQETFLRAYQSMRRYDNSRPFSTWLLSIAAHYCIDQIRKRRVQIVSVEELPVPDLPDVSPGMEFEPEPEGRAAKDQSSNRSFGCNRPGGSSHVLLVRFFLRRNMPGAFAEHERTKESSPPCPPGDGGGMAKNPTCTCLA